MKMMRLRKPVLVLLLMTVLAPIVLYTDRIATFSSFSTFEFIPEPSTLSLNREVRPLNLIPQELSSATAQKEPFGDVYLGKFITSIQHADGERSRQTRQLHQDSNGFETEGDNPIRKVTQGSHGDNKLESVENKEIQKLKAADRTFLGETKQKDQKVGKKEVTKTKNKKIDENIMSDSRVRNLKDQLIRARIYLSLSATRTNAHFIKELRLRMKEVQKALGEATKDADLPKNAHDKMKAMEQTLAKGKQIQDDCTIIVKKLRAIIHSTKEQLRVHKKQAVFLTHLTAKTVPKGLHCLPLRLSTEYYSLNSSEQQLSNQEKLEDSTLFHYALFSDNVLATSVVVNSTVSNAKVEKVCCLCHDPSKHVFHIVIDKLNYAAMRMWFLANLPDMATIQVQNIDEFTWLNASYSPVLIQLASQNMIDYYFKTQKSESDPNLKFRNPKYLSMKNFLRFYLPEIFQKLNKVVFLDDDIVVQKDLSGLWSIDLKGKVNGAVETCGENFHLFDRYLNFSNPIIAKN